MEEMIFFLPNFINTPLQVKLNIAIQCNIFDYLHKILKTLKFLGLRMPV